MRHPRKANNHAKEEGMKEKVFQACLDVIEKEGWKAFTFSKASQNSGIPLSAFHSHFSVPFDVMVHMFHKIDEEVLKNQGLSEGLSPKDTLFDILMIRFDMATPYKAVIKSFWKDTLTNPKDISSVACQGCTSMAWMLEAAGLNSQGFKGTLRVQGLTLLYLLTLKTWLHDNSPDQGKTMIFLDKGLEKLERIAPLLNFL